MIGCTVFLSYKVLELKVIRRAYLQHSFRTIMNSGLTGEARLLFGNAGMNYTDETILIILEEIPLFPEHLANYTAIGNKTLRPF